MLLHALAKIRESRSPGEGLGPAPRDPGHPAVFYPLLGPPILAGLFLLLNWFFVILNCLVLGLCRSGLNAAVERIIGMPNRSGQPRPAPATWLG
jgi:hypothetical protein